MPLPSTPSLNGVSGVNGRPETASLPMAAAGWRAARWGCARGGTVFPLDAGLGRGSHGVAPADPARGAVMICSESGLLPPAGLAARHVRNFLLGLVTSVPERLDRKQSAQCGKR